MIVNKKAMVYKEKTSHGASCFPFGFYEVCPEDSWSGIKHHWHDEIEMLYFAKGQGQLNINMEPFSIEDESLFFINSGELHSASVDGPCQESAILFNPKMLGFDIFDNTQNRLMQPLISGKISLPHRLDRFHPAFTAIKKEILEIEDVCRKHSMQPITNIPSQLFIKAGLLKILANLLEHLLIESPVTEHCKIQSLKATLSFIHEHYAEKIYVPDLAKQANMSKEYFSRFFKETIGQPPSIYLKEYRIQQAILLLERTDETIMNISLRCGFNSLPAFLRAFKKHTNTTPAKYRQAVWSEKSQSSFL